VTSQASYFRAKTELAEQIKYSRSTQVRRHKWRKTTELDFFADQVVL